MLELLSEFCLTPVGFQGASVREAQRDTALPDISDVERGTLLTNEKRSISRFGICAPLLREKLILAGLCLSKYDSLGLKELGIEFELVGWKAPAYSDVTSLKIRCLHEGASRDLVSCEKC